MENYLIKYRRVVEGEVVVRSSSPAQAQKLLSVELACGAVPAAHVENHFLEVVSLTESTIIKEVPRV